jgi:hypothetical protein
MIIELSTPTTVRITWPAYDMLVEAQIVARLKTVPGTEGVGRRWYAPAIQTFRLMGLFPKASYDYAALTAAHIMAATFFDSMVQMGIEMVFDESGAICAVGEGVSPLIENLVADREHALIPFVAFGNPRRKMSQGAWQGPLSAEDARFEPLVKGIGNAKRKAEEEIKYPKRRPRRKAKVTK